MRGRARLGAAARDAVNGCPDVVQDHDQGLDHEARVTGGEASSTFDSTASTYSDVVSASIAFGPASHDFYVRRKADLVVDLAARHLGDLGRKTALDVGCGVGLTDEHLVGRVGTLHGVDVAEEVVAAAARRNPAVEYRTGDGTRLPYEDGTFDLAFAICVLHHVPKGDWGRCAAELARVVRPGGLVVIFEHNPRNPFTRLAVGRCELDAGAVLLGRRQSAHVLAAVGLAVVEARYILFLPVDRPWTARADRLLAQLPLGAQHYVAARRSA
jgi:SAM-dependent methyltransferase